MRPSLLQKISLTHFSDQEICYQVVTDGKQTSLEAVETKISTDVNRKKNGRGRGNSSSGRGRGTRVTDQIRSHTSPPPVLASNGQLENAYHRVCLLHCNMWFFLLIVIIGFF